MIRVDRKSSPDSKGADFLRVELGVLWLQVTRRGNEQALKCWARRRGGWPQPERIEPLLYGLRTTLGDLPNGDRRSRFAFDHKYPAELRVMCDHIGLDLPRPTTC